MKITAEFEWVDVTDVHEVSVRGQGAGKPRTLLVLEVFTERQRRLKMGGFYHY